MIFIVQICYTKPLEDYEASTIVDGQITVSTYGDISR